MPSLCFRIDLFLLPTDQGGRKTPIVTGYRPNWDFGNTWLGEPMMNDAQILLDDQLQLAPGQRAFARLQPFAPQFWGRVRAGTPLSVQEGNRIVGFAKVLDLLDRPDGWTPEVAIFVHEVRQLLELLELAVSLPLDQRLHRIRHHLLSLYAAATQLPHVDSVTDPEPDPLPDTLPPVPSFDSYDFYSEVLNPYDDTPPATGSLSDDLLDIRADLLRGLSLWNRDHHLSAIWDWRFHFDHHWGDHAAAALRALHHACKPPL